MSRGANWKQLAPHMDDVSGRGRTDISARDRFVNFLDPKLYYKEFSQSEEDALEQLMVKYFPERINPPVGKKRRYALLPKEWKFVASKFRSSGNKRSQYQVKRTWYMMRRKYKTNQRSLPKKGEKCGLNKDNFVKVGTSKPTEKKTLITIRDNSIGVKRRSPMSSKRNENVSRWKKPQSLLQIHAKKTRL